MKKYFILIGNNGNHHGFNRKWKSSQIPFFDLAEAEAALSEIQEELEPLEPAIIVGEEDELMFDGGYYGYAPYWLQLELGWVNEESENEDEQD